MSKSDHSPKSKKPALPVVKEASPKPALREEAEKALQLAQSAPLSVLAEPAEQARQLARKSPTPLAREAEDASRSEQLAQSEDSSPD